MTQKLHGFSFKFKSEFEPFVKFNRNRNHVCAGARVCTDTHVHTHGGQRPTSGGVLGATYTTFSEKSSLTGLELPK